MGYLVSIHGISSRVVRTCLVGKVLYLTGPAEGEVQGWLPIVLHGCVVVVVVFHVLLLSCSVELRLAFR